ncbi:hypothetical protein D9758_012215 [Tetrapyrgos nigripes]|uniref:Uncharacterized protein n=1 Tax=Tetrapyrgos nigripes TaxID=182062 RepID=A0A8H5CCV4_9AGAR|nr:hypothetical protein D9758_012215 [Tetrapyrgos nigripes]
MARTSRVRTRHKSQTDVHHIDQQHARAILDVLELIDSDGLLDRVFNTVSLRTLLHESASFETLRSAVHSLFPIHSHPRARPSKPAAQQLNFCNLALSLLDQAASQSLQLPLDVDTLIPESSSSPSTSYITPRYALVQHLPNGSYWSSLNSPCPTSDEPSHLKDLSKGHAELAAVLPSPYPSSEETIPTLGSYHKELPAQRNAKLPSSRYATTGSFLDYGIWASFAPSFDQEGVELGRNQLGELYYDRLQKKKKKQIAIERFNRVAISDADAMQDHDQEMQEPVPLFDEDLLSPEQVAKLKNALDSLQLECAVTELLDRNRKALQRLQYLQYLRLMQDDGGSSTVEEGSEEWETAQSIMDSLSVLASLRPRSSKDDQSPLVPSPAALHLLHRTLPLSPIPGWHGNLPPGQSTALRDDSTIKVKPGATLSAPTPVTPATASTAAPYGGYQFNYGAVPPQTSHYRTTTPSTSTSYIQYKPTQTSYYQSAYSQTSQTPYYGSVAQQPYGATGWYNSYNPANAAAAVNGTGSGSAGRGTPQPGVATPAPSYSSFFSNALSNSLMGQRTPAVGNTVVKPGAHSATSPQVPTLPVHLQTKQAAPMQNGAAVSSVYSGWGNQPGTMGTPAQAMSPT